LSDRETEIAKIKNEIQKREFEAKEASFKMVINTHRDKIIAKRNEQFKAELTFAKKEMEKKDKHYEELKQIFD